MGKQTDDSVLTSLRRLEQEHARQLRQQALLREAEQRQVEQQRRDAVERAAQQEQQRLLAEGERERQRRLQEREAEARIEALREAELERARLYAANHAQQQQLASERAHALQLEELRLQASARRLKVWALAGWGSAAALTLLGNLLYWGVVRPAETQAKGELQTRLLTVASQRRLLDDALTAERRLSANQHDELESLHARVRKLEAELAGARPPPPISHRPPPVVAQPPITPPPTTSCRDDGDPLNGCLR